MTSPSLIAKLAAKSQHKQHTHACIITRGGAVVAMGYNHGEVHAEDMALSKLWPSERRGARLYSFRLRADGSMGMAKPCAECMKLIEASGIKSIIYSDTTGQIQRMRV